jgi:hypothetical protein
MYSIICVDCQQIAGVGITIFQGEQNLSTTWNFLA